MPKLAVVIVMSTPKFLLVRFITSSNSRVSTFLKWMILQGISCLAEKIGLLKRLKKDYLPLSTLLFLPSYS